MPTPSSTVPKTRAQRAAEHAKRTSDLADNTAEEKKKRFEEQYAANAPKKSSRARGVVKKLG